MKYVILSDSGAYLSKFRDYPEWKFQEGGGFRGAVLDPKTLVVFENRADAKEAVKKLQKDYQYTTFEILKCREKQALQIVE